MSEKAIETFDSLLKNRSKFESFLQEAVSKLETTVKKATERVESLNQTKSNITELSAKVEHRALIPFGKRIHVAGTIVHPGEYFIDRIAYPDSYTTVETAANTVKYLDRKLEQQREILERCRVNLAQLEQRMENLGRAQASDKIVSDRGIAVRCGEFYEILEYED